MDDGPPPQDSLRYASVHQRASALALDGVVLITTGLPFVLTVHSSQLMIAASVAHTLFCAWYAIDCVRRWGGTPGVRLLKLRVIRENGGPVGLRAAALRYAPAFAFSVAGLVEFAQFARTHPPLPEYTWDAFVAWAQAMPRDQEPPIEWQIVHWVNRAWMAAEVLALLLDAKRRTLHDMLAGTVVIDEGPVRERPATAPFVLRGLARTADIVLFVGPVALVSVACNRIADGLKLGLVGGLGLALAFWMYTPARWGGTPGKLLLGLRIYAREDEPLSLARALLRALPELGLLLAYWLGWKTHWVSAGLGASLFFVAGMGAPFWLLGNAAALLFTGRRSLADILAGTVVKQV